MDTLDKKIYAFEYMINAIVERYSAINGISRVASIQQFDKLKLIKLNFFISAVNANDKEDGLLDIFDKFYAMPYGHVESDLYEAIKHHQLGFFDFKGNVLEERKIFSKSGDSCVEKIDAAIDSLLKKNPLFFNYDAFQLVELSHEWYSWRLVFDIAQRNNVYSHLIPKDIIKSEVKFFEVPDYAKI